MGDYDKALAAAAASVPPCKDYIDKICTFVRLYGGGAGAPVIRYLDSFSKEFGESRKLGETFFTAIVELIFRHPPLNSQCSGPPLWLAI